MARQQEGRKYVLRGYVTRRSSGKFLAVCLKPYLVVEGRTAAEARHRLDGLIHAYITDAVNDGQLDLFMSRRAPVAHYRNYLLGQILSIIRALNSITPFTETCCVPQHA